MIKKIALASLALNLSLSANSYAENIAVTTGNDYAPYTDESLPDGGLHSFLIKKIYESGNLKINLEFRPWARGYKELLAGKYAATFPYIRTAEREKNVLYSKAVSHEKSVYFTKAGSQYSTAKSFDELEGATICIPVGYEENKHVREMIAENRLYAFEATTLPDCIGLVHKGRADIVDIVENIGRNMISISGYKLADFDISPFSDDEITYHMIFPKSDPMAEKNRDQFDKLLSTVKENGQLEKLAADYMDQHINN